VFSLKPRVLAQYFCGCGTVGEVVQYDGHWDTRAYEANRSMQDLRVSGDVLFPVHGSLNMESNSHLTCAPGNGQSRTEKGAGCDA
jgi:hypothetical protein